ncbi:hypothetical protein [Romboutsia hominis]|uniref:Uncharacterized protein n=1 Tax=Romboutsia hominis TaxID=1507512 RepID=A0A2P2BQU7_9FIRM|nr:hypothetical protein [Romboutsia hominis]CEI72716.1 Hypothetical protein FRIFI_1177 [Romboutsia hominis]
MLSSEELKDLQSILAVQHDIIYKINNKIDHIEKSFENNNEVKIELAELDDILAFLEENSEYISPEDIDEFDESNISELYNRNIELVKNDLKKIDYIDWNSYVCECIKYSAENDLDIFTPYEAFLSEDDLKIIKSESYKNKYRWDKIDYVVVGVAGFLAALTDILIVSIPKDMNTGKYKGQKGSEVTKWLHSLKLPEWLQEWSENFAKVSYDNTGGSNHRIDTPGHDPILGLVFGVLDIMLGNATVIKGGDISTRNISNGTNILEAIIKQMIHLLSDVATKRGLPVPFASLFRLINIGSFERGNGKTGTVSDLAGWMYHHGYDLRHFVTMSITPATIEIIIRAYIMIRHYAEDKDEDIKIHKDPKYRSMLLSAHAIASAMNAGKVTLAQGNPLAINYSEWLALLRYLLPTMKYWVFDKHKLEIQHLENINDDLWNELTINSYEILDRINYDDMPNFELGSNQV